MDDLAREFDEIVRDNGYRSTWARQTIIAALVQSGGHISAERLVGLVHEKDAGIGRMTVYRTLDLLTELGLIRPVFQGTTAAQYVILDDGHHHHLVCTNCAKTIHFDECGLDEVAKTVARRYNFQIHGHLVEFYGVCEDCSNVAGA
jgi:Fur family ferric uptake transcriptional regulator